MMVLGITGVAGYVTDMLASCMGKDSRHVDLLPGLRAMKYHQQQPLVNGTTNGLNHKL